MASIYRRKTRSGSLSDTYTICYRDAEGRRRVVQSRETKYGDAQRLANELERDFHRVRMGLVRPEEVRTRQRLAESIDEAADRYTDYLRKQGNSDGYVSETRRAITFAAAKVNIGMVSQITPGVIELLRERMRGRSGRTINLYVQALKRVYKFALEGPSDRERETPTKLKRAFSAKELDALLHLPIARTSGRRLVYLLAARTGLRFSEIGRVTWAMIDQDEQGRMTLTLPTHVTKNRRGAVLPIASDLADELACVRPMAAGEALNRPAFPKRIRRATWKRDIDRAGLTYTDDDGRILGMHSLRYTFNTMLFESGAPAHVVMWLMRHSRMKGSDVSELTTGVYADRARLLEMMREAVEQMVKWHERQRERRGQAPPAGEEATA